MAKNNNKKRVKRSLLPIFAAVSYILSVICICAGIVGIGVTQKHNFENKKTVNTNMNKTVSTKDLMASFQVITERREAEAKAKRIAAEKAKKAAEEKARKEAEAKAASLATTAPKGEIQQYAHDLVINSYGWTEADFTGLVKLWNRESGWNPNSRSSSGACGIPQALPCSKIANSYGSNTWENQVKWGLRYISGKYGSASNAWAFFQNNGWY